MSCLFNLNKNRSKCFLDKNSCLATSINYRKWPVAVYVTFGESRADYILFPDPSLFVLFSEVAAVSTNIVL